MQLDDDLPSQDDLMAPIVYEMGKVLFLAQQLEVNLLFLTSILSHEKGRIDGETFIKGMQRHEVLPLGSLAKAFKGKLPLPDDLEAYLKVAVDARNSIVHGFILRNTMQFRTTTGRDELLNELRKAQHVIDERRAATELALNTTLKLFGGDLEEMRRTANQEVLRDILQSVTLH